MGQLKQCLRGLAPSPEPEINGFDQSFEPPAEDSLHEEGSGPRDGEISDTLVEVTATNNNSKGKADNTTLC